MKRSRLRSNILWRKTEENIKLYVKQRNKCVYLLKKAKKEYYQNLDEKNVINKKKVSKTVNSLISDKSVSRKENIWLKMKRRSHLNLKVKYESETLNNFFSNSLKFQNSIQTSYTIHEDCEKTHTDKRSFIYQFSYCPPVWMWHENNNKINRLHEKCIRIVYNDKQSSFNWKSYLKKMAQPQFIWGIYKS